MPLRYLRDGLFLAPLGGRVLLDSRFIAEHGGGVFCESWIRVFRRRIIQGLTRRMFVLDEAVALANVFFLRAVSLDHRLGAERVIVFPCFALVFDLDHASFIVEQNWLI